MADPDPLPEPDAKTHQEQKPLRQGAPNGALIPAFAVFPLLILVFIVSYTKPYPIWETWVFIDVWRLYAEGGEWARALLTPRWGHIHALPNLVNLVVGSASCYSMLTDTVIAWVVTVVAWLMIARQLPRDVWLLLGVASAIFTTRLAEVWLNSWNLMWGLSLLQAALIGTCLARPSLRSTALALLVGTTAIFTAGQGVAIVAAGLVPLALHVALRRTGFLHLLVWAVFSGACLWLFGTLTKNPPALGNLLTLEPQNLFNLLGLALGTSALCVSLLLLAAGLVVGYALRDAQWQRLRPADLFWIYLVALLLGYVTLLAANRPGQLLPRYLMFLWIGPAALIYLARRLGESNAVTRNRAPALPALLCAGWIALNLWQSYEYVLTIEGWEPLSRQAVSLARSDPQALRAEMLKGIAANDIEMLDQGLTSMKALRVNIFCRP